MTQGRALFTMQFSHYQKVPQSIEKEILEKIHGKVES
jgi:elongation factor G